MERKRSIGVTARGIRLPIIKKGDGLADIVCESLVTACNNEQITLTENDILGVTEAIVAKSQGNYASVNNIAQDIRKKFPSGTIGLVFPLLSRNRFYNILKGIAAGADKVCVLLSYPTDEVGNPVMDESRIDEWENDLTGLMSEEQFRKVTGDYVHPFTGVDYVALYSELPNVEVYFSRDPRDILKLTKQVIVGEIHTRFRTKARIKRADNSAEVYTLSDILSTPVGDSGFNPDYGVLGSNLSTDEMLKLFPRDCKEFVNDVRAKVKAALGVNIEVLVYGDGAFKDPAYGIWELADPVVSPGYTDRLDGRPNEIKIKYVADSVYGQLNSAEATEAVTEMIRGKKQDVVYSEGTTPRKYADLVGSLCDLMSGSGDKGTPVILIQGYFDDYSVN